MPQFIPTKHLTGSLDTFTRAYIEAVEFTECHGDNPEMENAEFSKEFLDQAQKDCTKFQAENDLTDYPTENAGHDFWLTRCGHGCGFWEVDFGTESQCEKLTSASKHFGNVDIYVGDDGLIYC